MSAIKESPYYKGLSDAQQRRLLALFGDRFARGFDENGLSMAFPYMAPDNNNYMFGDRVAKDFIMNKNRAAAKSGTWTPR